MANSKDDTSLWSGLFTTGLYKRNQGRLARQLTAVAIAGGFVYGAWSMSITLLGDMRPPVRIGIPVLIAVAGAWLAFRLVNWPRFANFLVAVEAEMDKVSWPKWPELYRYSVVVVVTMFLMAFALFGYDMFWQYFFHLIGFLRI